MSQWNLSESEDWILKKLKAHPSTQARLLARSWCKLFDGFDEELERAYFQYAVIVEGYLYWRGRSKPSAVLKARKERQDRDNPSPYCSSCQNPHHWP